MFFIYSWQTFLYSYFYIIGLLGSHADSYIYKYVVPFIYNSLLISGLICSFFLENYTQIGVLVLWAIYIIVLLIIYNRVRAKFKRHLDCLYNILTADNNRELHFIYKLRLNLVFYSFFLYSCYCFVYTFIYNMDYNNPKYALRTIVGLTWFYYFMLSGAIFIYIQLICIYRKEEIKQWLLHYKSIAKTYYIDPNNCEQQLSKEFYIDYDAAYYNCKRFNNSWKLVIICAFTMISFRIPLGILYVFYYNNLLEIPTLAFQIINWFLLVYSICSLNDENRHLEEFLYKYKIFHSKDIIDDILVYNKYRSLGINLYGFIPNFYVFAQIVIIIFNIVLPILLAVANALLFKQ